MGQHRERTCHRLNTGVLQLAINTDLSGRELFRVAERINPKRSFLFVSTVLGRHIPVRPSDHFAAVNGIVDQIPETLLQGSVLVMGYAETAVGIGAAVARRIGERSPDTDLIYLSTTRHPVKRQEWVGFSEGHSHAMAHHVMTPAPGGVLAGPAVTLVLVDDEATTGSTFAALFAAVRDGGLSVRRVVLVTLTDWSDGRAARMVANLAPGIPVDAFSLVQGDWCWEQDTLATVPDLPIWSGAAPLPVWEADMISDPRLRAPRLGLRMGRSASEPPPIAELPRIPAGEPVLVIGTGEHVWGPMLLAERLELGGADVRLVATTRSPILMGEVIRHKAVFPDHYGLGVPMYLHNVPARPDVHVIIMTETADNGICAGLRAHLGRGHIIDGAGRVTEFDAR